MHAITEPAGHFIQLQAAHQISQQKQLQSVNPPEEQGAYCLNSPASRARQASSLACSISTAQSRTGLMCSQMHI